jgi:hypothetical protein
MTQTPIATTFIDYEDLKDRLYGIGYNLMSFCESVSISPSAVTKWKTVGVSYRYIALLEYLESLHTLNEKHQKIAFKHLSHDRHRISA